MQDFFVLVYIYFPNLSTRIYYTYILVERLGKDGKSIENGYNLKHLLFHFVLVAFCNKLETL